MEAVSDDKRVCPECGGCCWVVTDVRDDGAVMRLHCGTCSGTGKVAVVKGEKDV